MNIQDTMNRICINQTTYVSTYIWKQSSLYRIIEQGCREEGYQEFRSLLPLYPNLQQEPDTPFSLAA